MIWSYGITCVPQRFKDVLPKTIQSLKTAGFDNPRLFLDGPGSIPQEYQHLEVTQHIPRLRTFGNWITAAWELYIREPLADRFAIFQDDFVTYTHLREYLEKTPYPKDGYLNLYTFPANNKKVEGWHKSNQKGLGAVALVFDNKALRTLLREQHHIVDRPWKGRTKKSRREWANIDGGIVDAMRKSGYYEYCHTPSLVQHTGDKSSMENGKHAKAPNFRGEAFDARNLLKSPSPSEKPTNIPNPSASIPSPPKTDSEAPSVDSKSLLREGVPTEPNKPKNALQSLTEPSRRYNPIGGRNKRIGLVGYSCRSGLGELNRQIATYCDIDKWLIKKHSRFQTVPPPDVVDPTYCDTGCIEKLKSFVKSIDVLVMCETPYYTKLIQLMKREGKKIVWIPMQEWAPEGLKGWPREVDLTICPTKDCYDQFKDTIECIHVPWPIDTNKFEFKQRTIVEKFLFINGHGGINGRKGADVIRKAKELWPEIPLIVHSQNPIPGIDTVKDYPSNTTIYEQGDILLNPAKVDGIGLQRLEALACGMPVISTDGSPWIETPVIGRIECTTKQMKIARKTTWYEPNPESLVEICKGLLGKDISVESQEVREWAEENSWDKQAQYITNLIRSTLG